MELWELFVLAVGLSMDAFAVSVCKGLAVRRTAAGADCFRGPLDRLCAAEYYRSQYDPGVPAGGG